MPSVQCKQCGTAFYTKPSRIKAGKGKFCSLECYYEWQRGKPKGERTRFPKECEICGKEFEAYPSKVKKGWDRFCSVSCASKAKVMQAGYSLKKRKRCAVCGRIFEYKPSKEKNGNPRFCSIECTTEWRRTQRGKQNGNWRGGKTTFICEQCGRKFERYAKRSIFRFCSRECYFLWKSGENCYQWIGGKSFEPYPPSFNNKFKRMIRERDNYTCAICHHSGRCIHHIDYNKDNTTPKNCITLCRHCHPITNLNRQYWEAALSALVETRYAIHRISDQ